MRLLSVVLAALALVGAALAHGYLVNSSPAENARIRVMPGEVKLGFSEAIELRLSSFKVYALEAPPETLNNPRRLKELAEPLVERVLGLRGDEAQRADAGLRTQARTAENLEIILKPGLKPGAYVVMWRALSIDTHTTSDFYVFVYQP
ncbi:MAG: copper resistance protein CopC [Meiothermus sp.]|nr:copper resistance protein CopC [Meiothermus sp.]